MEITSLLYIIIALLLMILVAILDPQLLIDALSWVAIVVVIGIIYFGFIH